MIEMPLERFPCNPVLYYLKQSCNSKVNRLFLQLFSLSKICKLDEVWGCVEILSYPLVVEGGKFLQKKWCCVGGGITRYFDFIN